MNETVILARDGVGSQIVSIHAKRTYSLLPSGKCKESEAQLPLVVARPANAVPDEPVNPPWLNEADVLSIKVGTDLIVMAEACPPRGATKMTASIETTAARRDYRIWGERRAIYRGRGSIAFIYV